MKISNAKTVDTGQKCIKVKEDELRQALQTIHDAALREEYQKQEKLLLKVIAM